MQPATSGSQANFFFRRSVGIFSWGAELKWWPASLRGRGGGLQGRSPSIVFNERQYYQFRSQLVTTLHKLHARLLRVRHGKNAILQHANTSLYTSQHTVAALERLNFEEILPHPSQSPDMAPCDFFLFLKLEEHHGYHYDDDEVQAAVCAWLQDKISRISSSTGCN